jgi:hypothetical protein
MTTSNQNRECWVTTIGCLFHGHIVEHNATDFAIKVRRVNNGHEIWVHETSPKYTREAAAAECDELADYWQRKAKDLREEIDGLAAGLPMSEERYFAAITKEQR